MARQTLPKTLEEADKAFIFTLINATEQVFPKDLGLEGEANRPLNDWYETPDGLYKWKVKDLLTYVTDLTNTDDVRSANRVLYQTLSKAPEYSAPTYTGSPEPEVKANIPGEATREEQERLRTEREAKLKETQANSKQAVEAAIKKLQEINAQKRVELEQAKKALEGVNIYVKVQKTPPTNLSPEEQNAIDTLQNQINTNPKEAIKTIADEIKRRLAKIIPPDEIDVISQLTAYEIVKHNIKDNNTAPSKATLEQAVIEKLHSEPQQIAGIVNNGANNNVGVNHLEGWIDSLAKQNFSIFKLAQIVSISAFGEKFQQAVLPDISVEISTSPQEGYDQQFSLSKIPLRYSSNILDNQQSFLSSLKKFSETKIKDQIFSRARSFLESRIAELGPTHPLNVIYNSEIVQASLSYFGLGPPIDWIATNGIGRIAISMGYEDALGWLGEITGTSGFFGIAKVASAAKTAKTALTIERAGGIMASEAFLGGAGGAAAGVAAKTGFKAIISKVTTAISTAIPIPVLNWIIGFVGGELIGKLIEKIPWHKVKKLINNFKDFFVGGAFALIGFGLAGSTGAFWGGIGGFLGSKALLSTPIERAVFGNKVGFFFQNLFYTFMVSIGTPILVTLLVFPVVVALILFIINSGAYVVPRGGFGTSGVPIGGTPLNLDCNNIDNSLNPSVRAAILIACALDKFRLNPLYGKMVDSPEWQNLTKVLNNASVNELSRSAISNTWLQCVGFASATAGQAYGSGFQQINACSYVNNTINGYRYVSGTKGMSPGDFFIIGSKSCSECGKENAPIGSCGHIGVVLSIDGVGVSCADANAIGKGMVRTAKGCFVLSQITGYLTNK